MPSKLYQMLNPSNQLSNPQYSNQAYQEQMPTQQQMQPNSTAQNAINKAKNIMNNNGMEMGLLKLMIGKQNPKDVFYNKCAEMGVNPNDILNLIK